MRASRQDQRRPLRTVAVSCAARTPQDIGTPSTHQTPMEASQETSQVGIKRRGRHPKIEFLWCLPRPEAGNRPENPGKAEDGEKNSHLQKRPLPPAPRIIRWCGGTPRVVRGALSRGLRLARNCFLRGSRRRGRKPDLDAITSQTRGRGRGLLRARGEEEGGVRIWGLPDWDFGEWMEGRRVAGMGTRRRGI